MGRERERRGTGRVEHASSILHREYMLAANKPEYRQDTLTDISSQGVSFTTDAHYEVGALLEARLLLYGWDQHRVEFYSGDPRRATDPLVALIKITNARPAKDRTCRIGARFEAIDEWHRKALELYLAKQARQELA